MWIFRLCVLALVTLLPGVAGFVVVERLRGWLRIGAVGLILTLCCLPPWLTKPVVQTASLHSPDAGGYLTLGALLMTILLLLEAITGMVIAAALAARQRKAERAPENAF